MITLLVNIIFLLGIVYSWQYIWYLWRKKKRLAAIELSIISLIVIAGSIYEKYFIS